ncbi:MAG: EAL domain-containing protein [Lysobacter sp.]|nr:EAL domain-containing protein [Lysobacter sp.]
MDARAHSMDGSGTGSALKTRLRDAGGVVLGALALAGVSLFVAPRLGAPIWLANGLLLGVALRLPRDARWWLPLALLVDGALRGAFGAPWPLAGLLTLADGLELAIALGLLAAWRRRADDAPERWLAPGVVVGGLLAPLPAAALAAFAPPLLSLPPADLGAWWLGHATGLLMLAPLALAWTSASRPWRDAPLVFALATTVALGVGVLGAHLPAVALLLAPALLLAALALDGGAIALLAFLAGCAGCAAAFAWPGHAVLVDALPAPALQPMFAAALLAPAAWLLALVRTQRGNARAQAQEASTRLKAVLDHAPTLIAHFGRDLRHRAANREYLQWLGRDADAVLGRRAHEVLDEAGASRLASRLQRVFAGQPQAFELVLADGRALDIRAIPEFAADGSLDGACVMAQDLGWREQATRRFDALLAAAEPMLLLDAAGRIVQANGAAAGLFGMQPELLLQLPAEQFLLGASRETFTQAVAAARRGDADQAAVTGLEARHGDGSRLQLEARCSCMPQAGQALVAVALRDGSERQRLAQVLYREQTLAQAMLHAVADGVVTCDAARRITDFNPVAEELTGWPKAEAIGQPVQQVLRLRAAEGDAPLPLPLDLAVSGNRAATAQEATLLLHRDGNSVPVQAAAQPVHDAVGNVCGGLMVFRQVNEVRAMAQKMSHLAQHDYLTDLPNRVLLQDRLSQALATIDRGSKGALLFLDLDFFKQINDSIGHHAGDHVLKEIARRLKENVRADDTVSRQGGDEFVLLLVRLADPRDAARVAEKLIQTIEQPIPFEGQDLRVSASIGIALFPQDARDIQTLMKQADTALYHAKESGRGRYSYFTGIMSAKAEQRMRIEHDLRFALANNDFFLAYQPKVTLPDGRISGMEALVRWRRCDTGEVVPPGDFIPVAEEIGLISAIDEWVMREACRQNKAWQAAGMPVIPVSVNVSLARFDPDRLLAHVEEVLASTGLEAQWLEIEFTESEMFKHMERAQALIAQLKALGVQVAIDDFGTGYSGLTYLMRYRFDVLKIDRSFVQGLPDDPRNTAIVQAIVAMARALDYRVVAEGVETFAQADSLRGYGCNEMQGFLYGRPVPAGEFGALLRRGAIDVTDYTVLPRRA